jgi:UDP-glucose 4-epimerase
MTLSILGSLYGDYNMRILVTGGCGFIGSHIAEYHLAKGDEVSVVDDLSTGSLDNIASFKANPAFYFENANILNWPNLPKSVAWADRIYHMAAVVGIYRVLREPVNVLTTNIHGCEKLLHAVSMSGHTPQVIITSSSSVYGHSETATLSEKDDLVIKSSAHPLWNYALNKIADEALGFAYFHTAKIPITVIRLFNTIGPRQTGHYGMVVPRFVQQACRGEPITVFGDGTQTRSFCDVRDVLTALNLLASTPKSNGEIVNIGYDKEIVINDLAELIRRKANSDSKIKHIPYKEAYGEELTDIKQRRPDLTKLCQLTGFKHQWPLEKTIDDLIQKFRETK